MASTCHRDSVYTLCVQHVYNLIIVSGYQSYIVTHYATLHKWCPAAYLPVLVQTGQFLHVPSHPPLCPLHPLLAHSRATWPVPHSYKKGEVTDSNYFVVLLPNPKLRLRSEHAHASVHAQATVRLGPKMVHEPFWLRPTCLTPLPRESRGPLRNRLLDKRDALKVLKRQTSDLDG